MRELEVSSTGSSVGSNVGEGPAGKGFWVALADCALGADAKSAVDSKVVAEGSSSSSNASSEASLGGAVLAVLDKFDDPPNLKDRDDCVDVGGFTGSR